MSDQPTPVRRPWWVKVGLLGLSTRYAAWGFVWLSVALAVLSIVLAPRNRLWIPIGIGFFLAAAWYLRAIRWVDRNSTW
jgi:hypothetical protein